MSELEPTITELEPTATERLRALLDERGVEWEDMSIRPYACTSWRDPDGEPCTALEGADDIPDGKLSAQALLTPEQAIAATLGSCNCSNSGRTSDSDATAERRGDAVEVVRCRDCEHYREHEWIIVTDVSDVCHFWHGEPTKVAPDGFCAWGERKDE